MRVIILAVVMAVVFVACVWWVLGAPHPA